MTLSNPHSMLWSSNSGTHCCAQYFPWSSRFFLPTGPKGVTKGSFRATVPKKKSIEIPIDREHNSYQNLPKKDRRKLKLSHRSTCSFMEKVFISSVVAEGLVKKLKSQRPDKPKKAFRRFLPMLMERFVGSIKKSKWLVKKFRKPSLKSSLKIAS